MKPKEHQHKYERRIMGGRRIEYFKDEFGRRKRKLVKTGGYEVWKCAFMGCNSYIPTELVIGRISTCWSCGQQLILDTENTKLKRPTHVYCRKVKESA